MFQSAFDYVRRGTEWERTVIVGGVLTVLSFLIVPGFVLIGYLLRVLRETMQGETERPPVFDDWKTLLVDGLKGYLVALVYGLVPAVALLGTFVFGFAGFASGTDAGAATGGLVLLAGSLVTLVLSLAVAYVLPAALMNYAREGRVGAAFAVGAITTALVDRSYATAFGYVLVLFLGVGLLAGILNVVPVLGAIASAFLGFYASVMAAYVFGTTDAETGTLETTEERLVDDRAAV